MTDYEVDQRNVILNARALPVLLKNLSVDVAGVVTVTAASVKSAAFVLVLVPPLINFGPAMGDLSSSVSTSTANILVVPVS